MAAAVAAAVAMAMAVAAAAVVATASLWPWLLPRRDPTRRCGHRRCGGLGGRSSLVALAAVGKKMRFSQFSNLCSFFDVLFSGFRYYFEEPNGSLQHFTSDTLILSSVPPLERIFSLKDFDVSRSKIPFSKNNSKASASSTSDHL